MRTSLGRIRLLVALSMLFAAAVTTAVGSTAPTPSNKIDPAIAVAIAAGEDPVNVIVTGLPHDGVGTFASRSAAKAALRAEAAGFFGAVRGAIARDGGTVVEEFEAAPAVHVLASSQSVDAIAALAEVERIDYNAADALELIAPLPSTGISPANTGGRQQVQAEDIWALGFRGEGIRVSVIDTGLDPNHEAYKFADGSSRIVAWKDFVNSRTTAYDDHGHGTHAGATAVGSALYDDPTFGVFQEEGVANRAMVMGAKFLNSGGSGSFDAAIAALQWSFDNGADITSNSWGAAGSSGCNASVAVIRTVRMLTDLGMLSVFAAGNTPGVGTVGGPACGESTLSVGAIDQAKNHAPFSSQGPCSDPDTGTGPRICPDIVAKGVDVRSAVPRGTCALCDPTGYDILDGTSMATPHAAGAVALAEQMKRFYTGSGWDTAARAEEQVFKLTSLDLGTAGADNKFGWGLPQLLSIYALLNASDDAVIVDTFSISKTVARLGDTSTLSFGVRNMGGAIATGTFSATLTDPNGGVTVIKSSTPSLGLLDGESTTHNLVVGGNLIPGDYTFTGTFDYTWVDDTDQTRTGSVLREGTIKVARVFIDMTLDGVASAAAPIVPQDVTFTATNTGNEDAGNVRIEVTFPDDYMFVPGENLDASNLHSRYANPTPSTVIEDRTFGRVTLVFNVGALAVGESFSFTATIVPTTPGTYRTLSVAKFTDGSGKGFSQGTTTMQEVGVSA